jgi:hypothetical protein
MSDTETNIDTETEVPVLEIDFQSLIKMCEKINLIDSGAFNSMPHHVKVYADSEKTPIKDLILELISHQEEENKWRQHDFKLEALEVGDNCIKFANKVIYDAPRIIIISRMNSVFIIPGEKSIAEGNCSPNEIIRLTNLISSQLFLLRFTDVKAEDSDAYDLKVDYYLIDRTKAKESNED